MRTHIPSFLKRKALLSGVLLAAVAVSILPAAVRAQSSNSTQVTATANVVLPITLGSISPLSFGNLLAGSGGSVTISVSGLTVSNSYYQEIPSASGGVTVMANQEGGTAPGPAILVANGAPGFYFAVTVPSSASVSLHGGGSYPMSVTSLSTNLPLNAGQLAGGVGGGYAYFAIGGTLNLSSSQQIGPYSGSFQVTVAYN